MMFINNKFVPALFVMLILMAFGTGGFGQEWRQSDAARGGQVTDVTSDGNGAIFAGTFDGGIFRSDNRGDNWLRKNSGLSDRNITAVKASAGDTVYAGTIAGRVFQSVDRGENWNDVSNNLTLGIPVMDIDILAGGRVMIATLGNGIFRSDDQGNTWQAVNNGVNTGSLTDILFDPANAMTYAAGYPGVYRSSDNGDNWTATGSNDFVNGLAKSGDSLFVATSAGLKRSADDGNTFETIGNGIPAGASVSSVSSAGDTVLVIANTFNSEALMSTDRGDNFSPIPGKTADLFYQTVKVLGLEIFVGSFGDGLYRSTNGDTLFSANDGLNATVVNGISGDTTINVKLATYAGKIEGFDPSTGETKAICNNLFGIADISNVVNGALYGVYNGFGFGQVIKTVGDSLCEPRTNNLNSPFLSSIQQSDSTGTILTGGEGGLFRSADDGMNWSPVNSGPLNNFVYDIVGGINGQNFFVSAQNGNFFSNDDGATFFPVPGLPIAADKMAVDPQSGDLVAAVGDSIYRVSDSAGVEEISDGFPNGRRFTDLEITGDRRIFAAIEKLGGQKRSAIYEFDRSDRVFRQAREDLFDEVIGDIAISIAISKLDNETILVGTNGGGMYQSDQLTGAWIPVNRRPVEFQLQQNYPNPFNPVTTIAFTLYRTSKVSVKVFNVAGQEVAELFTGALAAGSHQLQWNAADLPSGNYFIAVSNGSRRSVRMATLLK